MIKATNYQSGNQVPEDLALHVEEPKVAEIEALCLLCGTLTDVFTLAYPEKRTHESTYSRDEDIYDIIECVAVEPICRFRILGFQSGDYGLEHPRGVEKSS